MTKISQEINNIPQDNLQALAQLFPSAVKDGQLDIKALKEELGDFEEVNQEKYELTWTGKQKAKKLVQEDVINRTLNFIEEDSKNADTTENLYIEGDNLEVLKLLRKNYYGSIKMIYIDPPYNTGNDFVYNDDFSMPTEESDIEEGTRDEEGNRLQKNQKSSNRYHANWLNMMYPRLKVAKDLLTDDGVIFISIDDNEVHDLRMLCDEIFGEVNFIGSIILKSNPRGSQSEAELAGLHDYVLIYSKNTYYSKIIGHSLDEDMLAEYKFNENGSKYRLLGLRQRGGFWRRVERPNLYYPFFINQNTGELSLTKDESFNIEILPIQPSTGEDGTWRWSKEKVASTLNELLAKPISRNNTETWDIFQKDFLLKEGEELRRTKVKSIWDDKSVNYQNGTIEIKSLVGSGIFNYPKPTFVLKKLAEMLEYSSSDIILDFFSGSSTTAHAVMQLNAEDNGNRKFIMVQLNEETDEKSEARKAGYNYITEIGKERIRRAGEKIKLEIEEANTKLKEGEEPKKVPDIGFKVFRVADTNIKWNLEQLSPLEQALGYDPDVVDFVKNSKDKDIVYEIMLRQHDIPLSAKLEVLENIGKRTYLYASSYLICLETEITQSMVDTLANIEPLPLKYVFRDSAFGDDINLKDETFRRLDNLIKRNAGDLKVSYTVEFI